MNRSSRLLALTAALFVAPCVSAQELTFRHFAGSGGGLGAEDGPVALATLNSPSGVTIDSSGNVLIADAGNHTIRRITPAGVVTTLAGLAGSRGSVDGRGSAAQFNEPRGIAVDGAGNVFVADSGNHTIRKVTPAGVVTTLAGMAGQGGFADGTGSTARFWSPAGLLMDGDGSVLVADRSNGRIRRVSPEGVVTTLTAWGGAPAEFGGPTGVAKDASGNIYVGERWAVAKLTSTGVLTILAGTPYQNGTNDGTGADARFVGVKGLASDAAGNLWVTDEGTIRSVSSDGVVTTIAGSWVWAGCQDGTGADARFDQPAGIVRASDGTLLVADSNNSGLRRVTPAGVVTTFVGGARRPGSSDGEGRLARFDSPSGMAFDSLGYAFVADEGNSTIRKVSPSGMVTTLAGLAGSPGSDDGTGSAARFSAPGGVAVDTAGVVLIADTSNHTIRKITPAGVVTTLAGVAGSEGAADGTGSEARFRSPSGIAIDGAGNAYVADTENHTIRKVTPGGVVTTVAGLAGAYGATDGEGPAARFKSPRGVAVDAGGVVLVADTSNDAIRRITPAGVVTTLAGAPSLLRGYRDGVGGGARFSWPTGVAVTSSGDALVVDQGNASIRRVTAAGVVTTVAGRPLPPGTSGSSSIADGTGSSARFAWPEGIAVAPDGRVFVTDSNTVRIGRPALPDVATIDAAAGPVGTPRQFGTSPQTATSWLWEPIRIEGASSAALTEPTSGAPAFTPDVDGYFVFRLTASTGDASRISTVALAAGIVPPTATLSGQVSVCPGSAAELQVELTGTPPWTLTWSDGYVQDGVTSSPATRSVTPLATTTYSVASVTNPHGQGSTSGSAKVAIVSPPTAAVSGGGNVCAGESATIEVRLWGTAPYTVLWSDGVIETDVWSSYERIVTPSATTTYTVTAVSDDVCSGTASGSATFTVRPLPGATLSGSTTICAGQSTELRADLTGTGPWTVTWSDGFVDTAVTVSPSLHVVSPGSTTTYTVTSVVDAFCSSSGTGSATVTVLAGPAPDVAITTPSPVAPGSSGLVASVPDAGPGATYVWTLSNGSVVSGQGAPMMTYSVGAPGLAVLGVTVSVPGGCAASGATSVWVGVDPTTPLVYSRVAGPDGGPGWFDGPAVSARLSRPTGVATDGAGNAYLLESGSVRKLTPAGRVSTLAGGAGLHGHADGQGSAATFSVPGAIASTASGVLFVADTGSHAIRRIDSAGLVSTLAGTPGVWGWADGIPGVAAFRSPAGIAVSGTGDVYVSDTGNHTIRKVTPAGVVTTVAGLAGTSGWADGEGSAARFQSPAGLAVDGTGNVFVADKGNHTIRRITPAGLVTTVAGLARAPGSQDGPPGVARFRSPGGVVVDGTGNLLVADFGNATIRLVTPAGDVSTLAGLALAWGDDDGTGPAARFSEPLAIAMTPSGDFLVADRIGCTIRRITPSGVVTTVAGRSSPRGAADGSGSQARFSYPYDVSLDGAGNAYVADLNNQTIRRITPAGVVTTLAGSPGVVGSTDGTGPAALFAEPAGVAVGVTGDLFVSDSASGTIRKVSPLGVVTTVAGRAWYFGTRDGTGSGARFEVPWGIAADAAGNVYVADSANHTIRKITPSGVVTTLAGAGGLWGSDDGIGSNARFDEPAGVAVDRFGNVFVADYGNATIRKVTPAGVVTTLAGRAGYLGEEDGVGPAARFMSPSGLRLDGSGNIYVADRGNASLRKVTPDGVVTTIGGSPDGAGAADGTARAAQIGTPTGVGVGYSGELLVSEDRNHSVWRGVSSLLDAATIDSTTGSVGQIRQLGVSPSTATSWLWELVRTEATSTAALSSTTVPNPTFTPDVPGYYRFRLTAANGDTTSITLVSLFVDLPAPTATVSGGGSFCPGEWVSIRADLTGIPPFTITWSDGEVWHDFDSAVGWRTFHATSSTTLAVTSFSDATGPGVAVGSAVVDVRPGTALPIIDAPSAVGTGSPNRRASVALHPGSTYSWWASNGTINSGASTNEIVFTSGTEGTMTLSVRETAAGSCPSNVATATIAVLPAGSATQFYAVAPCRVLDTRDAAGVTSGQPIGGGTTQIVGSAGTCGIPSTARALAANVTVTQPAAEGYLVLHPADEAKPTASTVHFAAGRTRASNTHLKLSTDGLGQVAIANESLGSTHVILDVSGYYQ